MANEKNLKPYKKGQSGNPAGRPPAPPELKAIKKMSKDQLELLMHRILSASPDELKTFKGTVLELWIASGASKAIQTGDYGRLNILMDRLYGKVPTTVGNAEGDEGFKIIIEDYKKNE